MLISLICVPSLAHYCSLSEITKGRWVRNPNLMRKAFTCCSWDSEDWKNPQMHYDCGKDDLSGQKLILMRGRTDINLPTGGYGCSCDRMHFQRFTVSERERWEWKTIGCETLQWNASQFCDLLGPRKVVFVGDSTMVQSGVTVANMIRGGVVQGPCSPQIYIYRMNTALDELNDLKTLLRNVQPHVVVVGFGAHYHNVSTHATEISLFFEEMDQFRKNHLANKPMLIWKTINFPHFNCANFIRPTRVYPSRPDDVEDNYQWTDFFAFDDIATKAAHAHDFMVMNMSMLHLRPDGHPELNALPLAYKGGDCLHYCLPGPLNIVATMLFHVLYLNTQLSS
eukprot:gene25480-30762_t